MTDILDEADTERVEEIRQTLEDIGVFVEDLNVSPEGGYLALDIDAVATRETPEAEE